MYQWVCLVATRYEFDSSSTSRPKLTAFALSRTMLPKVACSAVQPLKSPSQEDLSTPPTCASAPRQNFCPGSATFIYLLTAGSSAQTFVPCYISSHHNLRALYSFDFGISNLSCAPKNHPRRSQLSTMAANGVSYALSQGHKEVSHTVPLDASFTMTIDTTLPTAWLTHSL